MKSKVLGNSTIYLTGRGNRWTVGNNIWSTRAMTKLQAEQIFNSITTAKQLQAIIRDAYDHASTAEC